LKSKAVGVAFVVLAIVFGANAYFLFFSIPNSGISLGFNSTSLSVLNVCCALVSFATGFDEFIEDEDHAKVQR